MRLGEVCSVYGVDVDGDPDSGDQKVAVARTTTVRENEDFQLVLSYDEIESEDDDDDEEKPDEISDDSSNLEDEVPVATNLGTGRVRGRKGRRLKRGDGDDVAAGGRRRARKAGPRDWLLKYLQPNVSNVADRSDYGNAGTGLLIEGEFSRPARQSEMSCDYFSSSEEEQEQPPSAGLTTEVKPEGTPVVQVKGVADADGKDFTDFEALAFTKSKDANNDRPISEKAKLKDQAGNAQKTPVIAVINCLPSEGSPSVVKTQADDFVISPRKPLAQIHHRDLESVKCDALERRPPLTREKLQKENETPKKRRLSLGKDSRRQSSLKSFLKPFPVL